MKRLAHNELLIRHQPGIDKVLTSLTQPVFMKTPKVLHFGIQSDSRRQTTMIGFWSSLPSLRFSPAAVCSPGQVKTKAQGLAA
jgi:hypothetical protein